MISYTTTLIEGEIADYRFEEGILYSYSKPPKRTIKNITENIAEMTPAARTRLIPGRSDELNFFMVKSSSTAANNNNPTEK